MILTDPKPGDLCQSISPFEIISYGTGAMTNITVLQESEVFLILSASEIPEIPAWEFEIMYNNLTYYFNVPVMQGILDLDGQGGLYNFPFKQLKSDHKQVRR